MLPSNHRRNHLLKVVGVRGPKRSIFVVSSAVLLGVGEQIFCQKPYFLDSSSISTEASEIRLHL